MIIDCPWKVELSWVSVIANQSVAVVYEKNIGGSTIFNDYVYFDSLLGREVLNWQRSLLASGPSRKH